ncbi:hypothetical protein C800_01828 [Phocaeicola vulgatus dnLKV7]|uniref:Uncharacterized protein n=1 Tax=Phocaeicola vulgatus dnLKV7 TaxID=1235786 RepID=R9HJG0_PHOVU|nr:hypothetical protein C800_01828 [Phocaeicola vulgatus dnLKV7]
MVACRFVGLYYSDGRFFIPRNTEISDTEKYLTVGLSYMIIALLWIVLRKKEKAEERRERDLENKK